MLCSRVLAWLNHASVVGVTLESTSRQSHIKQGCFVSFNQFHEDLQDILHRKYNSIIFYCTVTELSMLS